MLNEIKTFFEDSPLAQRAAESIRNGREIGLTVKTGAHIEAYTFVKDGGRNVIRQGAPLSPDVVFTLPEAALKDLLTRNFNTIGQVGLHIFEKILSNDPNQKVQISLKANILSLVTGGYFGVLTAGGSEVAKFLATKGLGSMSKLRDAISKLRG